MKIGMEQHGQKNRKMLTEQLVMRSCALEHGKTIPRSPNHKPIVCIRDMALITPRPLTLKACMLCRCLRIFLDESVSSKTKLTTPRSLEISRRFFTRDLTSRSNLDVYCASSIYKPIAANISSADLYPGPPASMSASASRIDSSESAFG